MTTKRSLGFETVEIIIGDDLFEINLDEELHVSDLSTDMATIASRIGHVGALWAAAEEESQRLDGVYRRWRSERGQQHLSEDPKLAEWKVRQMVEETEKFEQFKTAQAACVKNVTTLKTLYEALRSKASMLQSKGAMLRAELESTDITTKKTEVKEERETSVRDSTEAVRSLGLGRKKEPKAKGTKAKEPKAKEPKAKEPKAKPKLSTTKKPIKVKG